VIKRILLSVILVAVQAGAAAANETPLTAGGGTVIETRSDKCIPMDYGYLYDADQPLEETMELEEETETYSKYRVTYVSVNNMTVPALYIVPKSGETFPALIFMNGKGGSKDDIMPYADRLVAEGFAVFAADPQYHGERKRAHRKINGRHIFTMVGAIRQTVLDYHRGIDFLSSRPEINTEGILYLGGSMGGIIGAIVCGVDTRIDACVLTVAGGPWTEMAKKNPLDQDAAEMNEFRKENNLSWDQLQELLDPADPVNFVGLISPRPLLMINGKNDIIVPPRATKILFEHAKQPKEIRWMNYSHMLPYDELLPGVLAWAKEKMSLDN